MKDGQQKNLKQRVENKMKQRSAFMKIIRISLLAIACYLLFVFVYQFILNKEDKPIFDVDSANGGVDQISEDSDGDGLEDWQEDLYGTSKKLADSDGDGMTDGEEVAKGFNPAYYGEGLLGEDVEPQRELFEQYKFEGDPLLEADEIQVNLAVNNNVTLNEIDVNQGYKTSVNKIGKHVLELYESTEVLDEVYVNLFTNNKLVDEDSINKIINGYEKAARLIDAEEVDPQVLIESKILARSCVVVAESLRSILDAPNNTSDEEHANLGKQYIDASASFQKAIIAIHKRTLSKGVTFAPYEPGHYFLLEISL